MPSIYSSRRRRQIFSHRSSKDRSSSNDESSDDDTSSRGSNRSYSRNRSSSGSLARGRLIDVSVLDEHSTDSTKSSKSTNIWDDIRNSMKRRSTPKISSSHHFQTKQKSVKPSERRLVPVVINDYEPSTELMTSTETASEAQEEDDDALDAMAPLPPPPSASPPSSSLTSLAALPSPSSHTWGDYNVIESKRDTLSQLDANDQSKIMTTNEWSHVFNALTKPKQHDIRKHLSSDDDDDDDDSSFSYRSSVAYTHAEKMLTSPKRMSPKKNKQHSNVLHDIPRTPPTSKNKRVIDPDSPSFADSLKLCSKTSDKKKKSPRKLPMGPTLYTDDTPSTNDAPATDWQHLLLDEEESPPINKKLDFDHTSLQQLLGGNIFLTDDDDDDAPKRTVAEIMDQDLETLNYDDDTNATTKTNDASSELFPIEPNDGYDNQHGISFDENENDDIAEQHAAAAKGGLNEDVKEEEDDDEDVALPTKAPRPSSPPISSRKLLATDSGSTAKDDSERHADSDEEETLYLDLVRTRKIRFADELGLPMAQIFKIGGPDDVNALGRTVILLLSPENRQFEFIQAEYRINSVTTVSDMLQQLAALATNDIFSKKQFVGVCRTMEGSIELLNTMSLGDCGIAKSEVLVAINEGHTAKKMLECATPLLSNERICKAVKYARRSGRGLKYIMSGEEMAEERKEQKVLWKQQQKQDSAEKVERAAAVAELLRPKQEGKEDESNKEEKDNEPSSSISTTEEATGGLSASDSAEDAGPSFDSEEDQFADAIQASSAQLAAVKNTEDTKDAQYERMKAKRKLRAVSKLDKKNKNENLDPVSEYDEDAGERVVKLVQTGLMATFGVLMSISMGKKKR